MSEPSSEAGRVAGAAIAVALAAVAVVFLLVAPAGALAAGSVRGPNVSRASNAVGTPNGRGADSQSPRALLLKAKPKPKAKKKKAKTTAAGTNAIHLGKRDYAEIALLALAPFVIVALYLVGYGYRLETRTGEPTAPRRRRWSRRKSTAPS